MNTFDMVLCCPVKGYSTKTGFLWCASMCVLLNEAKCALGGIIKVSFCAVMGKKKEAQQLSACSYSKFSSKVLTQERLGGCVTVDLNTPELMLCLHYTYIWIV